MAKKKTSTRRQRPQKRRTAGALMVFEKKNYVILLVSIGLIFLGYALMAIDNGRGVDELGNHLSLNSPLSLVVAPLVLLAGYAGIAAAILWRRKSADTEPSSSN